MRKSAERWGIDESLSMENLKELFSAEELAKLDAKGFLENVK